MNGSAGPGQSGSELPVFPPSEKFFPAERDVVISFDVLLPGPVVGIPVGAGFHQVHMSEDFFVDHIPGGQKALGLPFLMAELQDLAGIFHRFSESVQFTDLMCYGFFDIHMFPYRFCIVRVFSLWFLWL